MASTPQITVRVSDEAIEQAALSVKAAQETTDDPEVPHLLRAGLYALTMLDREDVLAAMELAELRRGWPARRRAAEGSLCRG